MSSRSATGLPPVDHHWHARFRRVENRMPEHSTFDLYFSPLKPSHACVVFECIIFIFLSSFSFIFNRVCDHVCVYLSMFVCVPVQPHPKKTHTLQKRSRRLDPNLPELQQSGHIDGHQRGELVAQRRDGARRQRRHGPEDHLCCSRSRCHRHRRRRGRRPAKCSIGRNDAPLALWILKHPHINTHTHTELNGKLTRNYR